MATSIYGRLEWKDDSTADISYCVANDCLKQGVMYLADSKRSYHVAFYPDWVQWHSVDSRLSLPDHLVDYYHDGVLVVTDFDVHDEGDIEYHMGAADDITPEAEYEVMQYPLYRRVSAETHRGTYLWFNPLACSQYSQHLDAQAHADMCDGLYDWIEGWYTDRWSHTYMNVTPIDVESNELEEGYAASLGGVESTMLEITDKYHADLIDMIVDQIGECEALRKHANYPRQMDLSLHIYPAVTI